MGVVAVFIQVALFPYFGIVGAISGISIEVADFFGIESSEKFGRGSFVAAAIGPYFAHFVFALIVVCVFFSIVLATHKQYTMLDCVVALLVFIAESLPIVGGFPMWGFFVWFLRVHAAKRALLSASKSEDGGLK